MGLSGLDREGAQVTTNKSSFSLGDLVRILNVPDQPKHIRDLAGKTGLVVEEHHESDHFGKYVRYSVVISGKIRRGFHHLDMEAVNELQ